MGRAESPLECLKHLDHETSARLAGRHLEALGALNASALRVVDKMPENTLYLGFIALLFPHARIIHCHRDVRDVALSCWMTELARVRWACDPGHIVSRINANRRVMDHWRRVLPVPILQVDYQATVMDVERMSRELVSRCGLDWDPACLEFHKTTGPCGTRQRRPGPAADLHELDRTMAKLREFAGIIIHGAAR